SATYGARHRSSAGTIIERFHSALPATPDQAALGLAAGHARSPEFSGDVGGASFRVQSGLPANAASPGRHADADPGPNGIRRRGLQSSGPDAGLSYASWLTQSTAASVQPRFSIAMACSMSIVATLISLKIS